MVLEGCAAVILCKGSPWYEGLSYERSLYTHLTVVILTCIFDRKAWDFHNAKTPAKNNCITGMNQNNLHEVLEDFKQDLEVDSTSVLYIFFLPFSNSGTILLFILLKMCFPCITYDLHSVSLYHQCRVVGCMQLSVPFLSLFLSPWGLIRVCWRGCSQPGYHALLC